ncbi:glutamyl-tRNA(Gln) amidotransferase subunit A [Streptomyces sulfonofaciens]|uniref:Glutamyl-tRNA(Gln) amidotransferase subunit A n=1 Tax=Streptomyces sulfonofaciens TaxID=68272 RepID=A0A919KZV0_9ACTN|nr:amidase [Streptomyces sulfonofaciens]GHH79615.1 glutamyl-tRNA(Gln) amidotransferase subunit A [Streptomyces sulfonofaciens]
MTDVSRREILRWAGGAAGAATVAGAAVPQARAAGRRLRPGSVAQAAAMLRSGEATSVELTRDALAAATALQPKLNAFITLTSWQALDLAAQRDAELAAGVDRGPLHGVPMMVKDLFDTAGVRTTAGSQAYADRVPTADATVIRRLREAGAVSIGKTNLNEFAAGIDGRNAYFGDVHNPWGPTRSPGGSSSGTGAGVAAGITVVGIGSDTGGSVRVPAAWNGIVGIRPTHGLVSLRGAIPRAPSFDVVGPFGRTVRDAAAMLTAMAGHDPQDPYSLDLPHTDYLSGIGRGIAGLRIGIIEDYSLTGIDPDVERQVHQAIRTFSHLGARIRTVRVSNLATMLDFDPAFTILRYEFGQAMKDIYWSAPDKSIFGPTVQADMNASAQISASDYEAALSRRPSDTAPLRATLSEVDVLLTPMMPTVAPVQDTTSDEYTRGRRYTMPFSYANLPSVVVPCGFGDAGLPVGLQLVGAELGEPLLLRTAAAFERAVRLHPSLPPAHA